VQIYSLQQRQPAIPVFKFLRLRITSGTGVGVASTLFNILLPKTNAHWKEKVLSQSELKNFKIYNSNPKTPSNHHHRSPFSSELTQIPAKYCSDVYIPNFAAAQRCRWTPLHNCAAAK
jgi:hypothetical protein